MNNLKVFLIIFLIPNFSQAQTIENWVAANERNPVEKIYIHTDAENYFIGDTAWFKIYLTDSRSGQLIPSAENVYVSFLGISHYRSSYILAYNVLEEIKKASV